MLNQLMNLTNRTRTENGAATLRSTGSHCVDLFATIGALRCADEREIETRFLRAYAENPDVAMKILFYARDVRGGLGERRVFRVLMRWLALNQLPSALHNLPWVPEYGRWDDLLALLDTPARGEALALLNYQLGLDLAALDRGEPVSLLGKWLPSVNAHSARAVAQARALASAFGMSPARYRRMLSALRRRIDLLENRLRQGDYTFDYALQPSQAMFRYRHAFLRNDPARYRDYLARVNRGEAALHTGTLMPYEIVQAAYAAREEDRAALDASWRALEDFTDGENALVVADGSGSMYWGGRPTPASVAQSLAIYFAQRNRGAFRDHFITFSMNPRLVRVMGADIVEQVRYCRSFNECANTDLQKVFELILQAAVENRLPQAELPSTLYIVSDMEFDACARGADITNFDWARNLYRRHGYRLPRVVFWNVQSRNEQQPVRCNAQGVALVSGCTPRIFSQVMSGETDPYRNMMAVVGADRYAAIGAR